MYNNCQVSELFYLGGIIPYFDGTFATVAELGEQEDIKRFLLEMGFVDSIPFITDCLAQLILASLRDDDTFRIEREYAILARGKTSRQALTLKLQYYVKKNYESVCDRISAEFGLDIGSKCCGNKAFVRKIAYVYVTYGKTYLNRERS